jgi:diaminopropionate ammonia-lyase family
MEKAKLKTEKSSDMSLCISSPHYRPVLLNPNATTPYADEGPVSAAIYNFHQDLPGYKRTPLLCLPQLAAELKLKAVYAKLETDRFGLPAFKILGASWATAKVISKQCGIAAGSGLDELGKAARSRGISLWAATEGNHGRAVARMAKMLGIKADIFVPNSMDLATREAIASEDATIHEVDGSYDEAVDAAYESTKGREKDILIQDVSFEGYEEVPDWIVDGYSTMLQELSDDPELTNPPTHIFTPVGVGSLAEAVVRYSKGKSPAIKSFSVEPDTAACLYESMRTGNRTPIKTSKTIMDGLDCGTVSMNAWPILKAGIDGCITVSDWEAHRGIQYLSKTANKLVGPCAGATIAALKRAVDSEAAGFDSNSVVVVLCTEGAREYITPRDITTDDVVKLTQILTQIDSSNPTLSQAKGAGETEIANYITSWLQHRDIEIHRLEETPRRPSIVGVVRGSGKGKSLMINGHIDTVSLGSYANQNDALAGNITTEGGSDRVNGRGSLDMKAGVAAAMIALLKAKNSNLRGDVILAAVSDEENFSLGTEEVLKAGWRADGAIIPEPTQLNLIGAHKGFVWVEIDVVGVAGHGSQPDLSVDAIMMMRNVLEGLDKLSQSLPHDENLGKASLHAGLIKGGEESSSYPGLCTVTVEFRTVPALTTELIVKDIESMLARLAQSTPKFQYNPPRVTFERPPFKLDVQGDFAQAVFDIAGGAIGAKLTWQSQPFWCDAALLHEVGIPSVVFGPAGVGLHAEREWVDVNSILTTEQVLSKVIQRFCS